MPKKIPESPRRLTQKTLRGLGIMADLFEQFRRTGYAKQGYIADDVELIERAVRWVRFKQSEREQGES